MDDCRTETLRTYENLLYPNMTAELDKSIPSYVWAALKDKARYMLTDPDFYTGASEDTLKHWKSISEGNAPDGFRVD